jgi:hypothetical protein
MAQVKAATRRLIAATPPSVLDALTDYRGVRPEVLPEHYSEYEVREGGKGDGTLVHYKLRATSKRVRDCLVEVSEPASRELVERDRNSSMVTTWVVSSGAEEGTAEVAVTTVWNGAGGIGGFFERLFAPKGLARIHDALLANLAARLEK